MMIKGKKFTAYVLLLVIAVSMLFAGCGSTQASGSNNGSQAAVTQQYDTSKGTQSRSEKLFEEHYEKHVIKQQEFGDVTKDEYLKLAQDLVDRPGSQVLTKKDEDKNTLYYDPDTNSFAVKSDDGYIRSFFKPSAGVDYYNRQK